MVADPLPSADAQTAPDRRGYLRIAVALPAFVHVDGERHPVQLVDLSPEGARVKGNALFPVGTQLMLSSGTLGRSAVVIWQNDEVMGLCFETELDARELASQIQRSNGLAAWMRTR